MGFRYGVRAAAFILERMHGENKKDHSFFLKASRAVLKLLESKDEDRTLKAIVESSIR